MPAVVERINNTFRRADQIQWSAGIEPGDPRYVDYFLPIVADAALSGKLGASCGGADQQHLPSCRSDPMVRRH
ncbi:hypothetical protein A7R67_02210 [Escherichia coli]|nr:hypothetical protein A7R67_02210 [Escherichia coli]